MQNFARKYQVEIDLLSFEFKINDVMVPERVFEKPEDGCFVYGMYLEGARWNYNTHKLDYSKNRELYTEFPLIHMIPVANRKITETVNIVVFISYFIKNKFNFFSHILFFSLF